MAGRGRGPYNVATETLTGKGHSMSDSQAPRRDDDPTTAPDGPSALPLGMPATRKLSARELGLVALALLAAEAGYGSQLSDRIERLSNGFYRPSPGMLYPVLGEMSERGHLAQTRQGRRKYYRVTAPGEAHLARHREAADRLLSRLEFAGRKLNALLESMSHTIDDEALVRPLAQEMLSARMDLKAALHESRHLSTDKQRRIIRLLQDTAARVRAETRA